jgi:hypothetical protein
MFNLTPGSELPLFSSGASYKDKPASEEQTIFFNLLYSLTLEEF